MEKAYKCTIALVPPVQAWDSIQAIRQVHDEQYFRWPPHVNLLYPFIKMYDEAMLQRGEAVSDVMKLIQPFRLSFNSFGYFRQKKHNTGWLAPEASPASAIFDIQAGLLSVFPECIDVDSDRGFNPHLSIGQAAAGEIVPLIKDLQLGWSSVSCTVYVMTRESFEDPFQVKYIIKLGTGEIVKPSIDFDINMAMMNINKTKPSSASADAPETSQAPQASVTEVPKVQVDKKCKMRTSEDVIKRLRWDALSCPGEWLIGYQDSSDVGIKEVTLADWDRGLPRSMGAIPMHRIQYFKQDGVIVWDRRTRLDRIFNSQSDKPE